MPTSSQLEPPCSQLEPQQDRSKPQTTTKQEIINWKRLKNIAG